MNADFEAQGTTRAFLAFEIPDAIRDILGREQASWRKLLPPARWVPVANQHLTVKFLGECTDDALACLVKGLRPRLAGLPPVVVRFGGAGFFPKPSRPRVAWIGGAADEAEAVVKAVESVSRSCGFEASRKPWALHLTQARLRKPWSARAVQDFLASGEAIQFEPFICRELVLTASDLQPSSAVYTALERIPLS